MKYVWVILCLLANHASASENNNDEVSLGEPSMLLALMADAKEEDHEYTVATSIISDYKISSYRAHVYFSDSHELIQLQTDFIKTRARIVNFTFKAPYLAQAYLVLEVKYGPNFLYDTNATGLCIVPFDGVSVFNQIPCNPLVTAKYLIASSMHNSPVENIINADATRQYLQLQKLPNRKFWQDYLALHQLILAHLAEIEDYQIAHSGQYLEVGYKLIQHTLATIRKYRRVSVQNIDDAALAIDKTMVNFAYRLYMSIDGLLKRNLYLLPKVEESPTFIRDFFTGHIIFSLLTEEAAVVSGLTQKGDTLSFAYWPWFESITVRFDDDEPISTLDNNLKIPSGARRVDVVGYGSLGRYAALRYTILPFGEELKQKQIQDALDDESSFTNEVTSSTYTLDSIITTEKLSEKVAENSGSLLNDSSEEIISNPPLDPENSNDVETERGNNNVD